MTRGTKAALIAYFDKHPNQRVYVEDIMKELNLSKDQVRVGINNLRASEPVPYKQQLEIVAKGSIWYFHTEKVQENEEQVFKLLGEGTNGVLVLQDSQGNFYKATKLS